MQLGAWALSRLVGHLVLFVLAANGAVTAGVPSAASSLDDAESALVQVVSIRTQGGGARTRHGSAFYVSAQGHLLTCFHVLDRMPREDAPRLLLPDGREKRFEVLDVDREADLALLRSDPPERFLTLGDALLPDVGEPAVFGGTPLRRCTVVAVGKRRAVVNIKVDRFADPGHSGGPLLAEETLAVIGVMRANLESATGGLGGSERRGYGLAVPLLYVKPFVGRNLNLPAPARVSEDDKQEEEVCARHGWPGWRSFSWPPPPPAATSGPGSTP
jgi:S1-C subfamily serine protease